MIYTIVVLDCDKCELSNTEAETLKAAKKVAREKLSEPEYISAGAYKVEVRDSHNACVFDKFVSTKD